MPNERTFARYMSQGLRPYGHVQRHEDALSVGVADLSFAAKGVTAWIELKAIDAWPKRESTTVKLKTFTYEQLNWLTARAQHTPYVFLMLKVERVKEYVLLHADNLKELKEGMTRDRMQEMEVCEYKSRIDFKSLAIMLEGDWHE